jgi:hypothetical protein
MSSPVPTQVRTIDPFSSYNSNVVNKLTRIVTFNNDAIERINSCEVLLDSTASDYVIVSPGVIYKDDVLIEITNQHIVDFTDSLHYVNFDTGFDEAGYYYVVLKYIYQRQRPAPFSEILILKPSQTSSYTYNSDFIFLKAVHVSWTGTEFIIDSVHDYDPNNLNNKREYLKKYIGIEPTLPIFDISRDLSRCIYVKDENKFYLGYIDGWKLFGSQATTNNTILSNTNWIFDSTSSLYYQDVNLSNMEIMSTVINIWDLDTNMKIEVQNIEYISNTTVRVWMPINTKNLKFVAIG